jgi:hypothetical protein
MFGLADHSPIGTSLTMQSYNFLATKLVAAQRTATDLLKSYFASSFTPGSGRTLISTPTYSVTSATGVVVQLFSYSSTISKTTNSAAETTSKLSSTSLNSLVAALSRLFTPTLNTSTAGVVPTVPVQLRIVRLHHPYLNSSILAQFLAMNASKYGFARLRQYVLSAIPLTTISTPVPSGATGASAPASLVVGVKVQVSGLLTTQRMAPRKTVSTVSAGTFHGPGTHVDYSSHTSKSALGSYTVKV